MLLFGFPIGYFGRWSRRSALLVTAALWLIILIPQSSGWAPAHPLSSEGVVLQGAQALSVEHSGVRRNCTSFAHGRGTLYWCRLHLRSLAVHSVIFDGVGGSRRCADSAARKRASYLRFDLDAQPRVEGLRDHLAWLEREPEKLEWSIEHSEGGPPVRPLDLVELEAVAGDRRLPASFALFAERRDLQRRVRSATGCFLDLGAFAPRTSAGGCSFSLGPAVVSSLVDLYIGAQGGEAVLTSTAPIGFDLPSDWGDEYGEVAVPDVIPLDGSFDVELCADSFAEFLYRYWVEDELYFGLAEGHLSGRWRLMQRICAGSPDRVGASKGR
ncbi:MAG: hypothetical protein LC808_27115 [Actinobacteria bacterium]|nr:hypothetical protein [Actinomycetota bacterium]